MCVYYIIRLGEKTVHAYQIPIRYYMFNWLFESY